MSIPRVNTAWNTNSANAGDTYLRRAQQSERYQERGTCPVNLPADLRVQCAGPATELWQAPGTGRHTGSSSTASHSSTTIVASSSASTSPVA